MTAARAAAMGQLAAAIVVANVPVKASLKPKPIFDRILLAIFKNV